MALSDEDRIDGLACDDCVMMTVNNDRSGVSEDWDEKQWFLTNAYNFVEVGGKVIDFSTARCDSCLSNLAGRRTEIFMWEYPEN